MSSRSVFLSLSHKHYDPNNLEQEIYKLWEDAQIMSAQPYSNKEPFSIVIPPPNITGRLHMGHALNNSIQDALIRYKRMDGYDAVWIPGTDHAGISTQSVVKKHLDAEGIDYLELGREKVIKRIWQWKEKYGDQILMQLKRLGCSCDWSRTRFTMDEGLSKAVRTAFVKFYESGLIYRGKYIVNWCPVDRTALSDDEVITADGGEPGYLWHIRYPFAECSGFVIIATTRPETMLGDSAVAVNPQDERYKSLIGKTLRLPLADREIPIIADDYVDRSFGSGCLKVTPAHDLNDFQIGLRHNLPQINIMNEDATIGDQAPLKYHGLDRFVCRDRIVEELKDLGLLVKIEDRMTPIGRAQRSRAIIEYRLSNQWFVRMPTLAKAALKASEQEKIKLFPQRWERIYRNWLINTRDWCISRQIWWGHRIPAWYHKDTGKTLVALDTPEIVKRQPDQWTQDEDVLDTWFSSALWPYSTLGWPEQTKDLKRYYPTSVLSTAKDIIYFWVARMVMTGLNLAQDVPFKKVYFHPVICDANGETMSKSKGNGIDPLHIIDGASVEELEGPIREARPENMQEMLAKLHKDYPKGYKAMGADALRFTLLSLNSSAQQVQLSLNKFEEIGQRFIDKLWNASRFILSNLTALEDFSIAKQESLEDKWILLKLDLTVSIVRKELDDFHFSEAAATLYKFFWEDICDWYVELSKSRLKSEARSETRASAQKTLCEVYSSVLRLLHPLIPFITEELWGHFYTILSKIEPSASQVCALSEYPKDEERYDKEFIDKFSFIQEVVVAIRNMRSQAGLSPNLALSALLLPTNKQAKQTIEIGKEVIELAAKLKTCNIVKEKPLNHSVTILNNVEIYVDLTEHLDTSAELKRNETALAQIEKDIAIFQEKLNNPNFLAKAKSEIIEKQKKLLQEAKEKKEKLTTTIKILGTK